jgi:hypothetical protein
MSRWFRVYDDLVDDPKVQLLPGDMVKALLNLWCLASQNGGILPDISTIAFKLRVKLDRVEKILSTLKEAGLIDDDETGTHPHNWNRRQFKSDLSTERVKRHRGDKRNADETFHETTSQRPQKQSTESDTETAAANVRARDDPKIAEANALAIEVAAIAGYPDPTAWPPGWCGAPLRVIAWLADGWKREIILAAVRGKMARDGPTKVVGGVAYFEGPIADEHARQAKPLPNIREVQNAGRDRPQSPVNNSASAQAGRRIAELTALIAGGDVPSGQPADGAVLLSTSKISPRRISSG